MSMSGDGRVLFVGAHGMLMHETYGEKPVLIGEGLDEKAAKIPHALPRVIGGMAGRVTNLADANRYLSRQYREGWEL